MTTLVRLKTRLQRVSDKAPKQQLPQVDLSYLSGHELDRLRDISEMVASGLGDHNQLREEIATMIAKCPPLGRGQKLEIRPRFPSSLIKYWRTEAFNDRRFPRGNYYSHNMSYHARDRLLELAEQYGWNPETDDPSEIVDVECWAEEDYEELVDLLWHTISESERNLKANSHFRFE